MCYSMEIDNMGQSEDIEPDDDSEFVEVDPTGRYGRYNEELGKGAHKKVYKAFDKVEGIEVAWNKLRVQDLREGSVERLYSEVNLLRNLKHKNIMKFYNSWIDPETKDVNFITELFTSGTLRQYREKHKNVDVKAIKNWARQILRGLEYLHSHDPPIIHRDLKCDNIFINGNQGEVKIGDFGLAAIVERAIRPRSVLGTPEFMAPELYEENYNELVDIYAFGMCLLELVVFEYPYSECNNAVQVYKKVLAGIKPEGLCKFKNLELRRFVEKCLVSASERLPASELLKDPFLQEDPVGDAATYVDGGLTLGSSAYKNGEHINEGQQLVEPRENSTSHDNDDNLQDDNKSKDFKLKGKLGEDKISLKLRINDNGHFRCIQFPFDLEADTAISVASEMVGELEISDQDVTMIADMIDTEIRSLVPDWKAGASFDETDDVDEQPSEENPTAVVEPESPSPATVEEPELPSPATDGEGLMFGRFEEVSAGSLSSDSEPEHIRSEESGIFDHLMDLNFTDASSTNWIHTSVASYNQVSSYEARNGVVTGIGDMVEPGKDTVYAELGKAEDMCSSTATDVHMSDLTCYQSSPSQVSTSDCVMADAESTHKERVETGNNGIRGVDNGVVDSSTVHASPESIRSVNTVVQQGVSESSGSVNSLLERSKSHVIQEGAKTGGNGIHGTPIGTHGIHGTQMGTRGIRGGIPGDNGAARTPGIRLVSSKSDTSVITVADGIRGGIQGIRGDEKVLFKNETLQKKFAEMEARTLENLSSKNGYSCTGMVKKAATPISIL